jgi:1,4-dihydroxy-2-naphthoyl-CoA hydrolase
MSDDGTGTLLAMMPFADVLGIEHVTAAPERVTGRVRWAESRCTSFGVLHGGVLMALADSIGAYCAVLNLPAGAGTSTIESKTNFLRAVRSGHVEARARPLHVGRTTIVIDTELYDDQDRLVGRVTQTQAVLAPRS